jgi:YD repeat-containing protein
VVDPRPGGGEYGTGYTYDLLNHLTDVVTVRDGVGQSRKFEYNAQQRLWRVTMPESGVTTYDYHPDGTLFRKTFANGNKAEYGYDGWKRLTSINRFMAGSGTPDVCQSVTLQYDIAWSLEQTIPSAAANRLVTRTWGSPNTALCPAGQITEKLTYTQAGQVTAKQMGVNRNGTVRDLKAYWQFDRTASRRRNIRTHGSVRKGSLTIRSSNSAAVTMRCTGCARCPGSAGYPDSVTRNCRSGWRRRGCMTRQVSSPI